MAPLWILSSLLHLYVGLRIVPGLAPWPPAAVAFALLLAASAAVLPPGLRTMRRHGDARGRALHWAGMTSLGALSSIAVLTLLRDAGLLLAVAADALWPAAVGVEALARASAVAVPLLGLGATAWGFVEARRVPRIVDVEVPIAGLPTALEGFTIAQVSDLHVGATIRRPQVEAVVEAVNALGADAVAITGDLVDGGVRELAPHVAPLAGLRSRHGTFFVTGNHEYYSGALPWIAELRRLGLTVLLNEHVVLER
ncbi:MAG TPA: metallophosphoesterase, partial [Burkholderiaceae bacterium]|nr:metallophosphoesterase [Burkholderiaceae bacterium]